MIATDTSTKKTRWLPMLISSSTMVTPPMTRAGTIGVFDLPDTRAIAEPSGRRLSRAIENIMRMAAVWTARQQTVIATLESVRKVAPSVSPSVSLTTKGRPSVPISLAVMLPTAIIATSMSTPPARPAAAIARRIAGGVEPVEDVRADDAADEEGAEVAPVVAGAGAVGVQHHAGPARDVEREEDDQQRHADQLGRDADVVDPRHQLDADHVDDGREDHEQDAEDHRVLRAARRRVQAGVGVGSGDLERRRDLRKDHLIGDRHRFHRDDRSDDQQPAGHPGREGLGRLLRPLVDRAGERVLAGELGEAQRDEELAEEDDRPRPPERGTGGQEGEPEELEDAGQDRDVAEAGGEAREAPER